MKKISAGSMGEIYHTTEDCPMFPDETRDVTESDERRGVRECTYCKDAKMEEIV